MVGPTAAAAAAAAEGVRVGYETRTPAPDLLKGVDTIELFSYSTQQVSTLGLEKRPPRPRRTTRRVIVRFPMGKPKPCAQSITIPGYGTLPCNCEDSHPTRHIGLHWCVRDGGRNIMSYALTYLRMRHEKGYTDEKYAAAQLTVVICWGAWVGSVWVSPQAVDLPNTWYFMLIRGLRTVRTGYAHQPPAGCTYRRHRAACPGRHAPYVRRTRTSLGRAVHTRTVAHHRWYSQLVTLAKASGLPATPPADLRREYKALLRTVSELGNGSAGPRPVATDVRSGRRERLESTRLEPSHSPHPPTRARSRPQERIYEFFLKAQEKLSDVPRPQALETTVGQNDLSSRGLLDLSSRVDGHDTQIARLHLDLLSVRQGGIDLLGAKVTSSAPAPLPDFACELPGGEVGASVEAGAV